VESLVKVKSFIEKYPWLKQVAKSTLQ